jgi:N-glycosylase/DNA lyase
MKASLAYTSEHIMNTPTNTVRVELPIDQPLNLALTLTSGQAFRWHEVKGVWSGFIAGELVTLERLDNVLAVECNVEASAGISDAVHRYFRLDDDLSAIYDQLCKDERLSEAIHLNWGLRILRQDPWECLVAFICSQNSNIPRIASMQESMANTLGETYSMGDIQRQGFPSREALASAGEDTLRKLALGYRAKYLVKTAEIVASGGLDLDALREVSYDEAKAELMALPGVGAKVADCVLLFALDKLEAVPIDRWVRRAFEEWDLDGEELPYDKLLAWALQTFGSNAGYAQQYLFFRRRQVKD